MSNGERSALEGVLTKLKPGLAIEIGTAGGASLGVIASHAGEVHSFDLFEPARRARDLAHVTLHTGDSHELLPRVLDDFTRARRNVDFVLVDGDHSAEGVRRDLENLLGSPALVDSTILIHDTSHPTVRTGVEAVDFAAYDKVVAVELDWISGYIFCDPHFSYELWGGLGCVIIDADSRARTSANPAVQHRFVPIQPLLEQARLAIQARESASGRIAPQPTGIVRAPTQQHVRADAEHELRVAAEEAAHEQLARGDAEHEMRVAAQRLVGELDQRLREETSRGPVRAALAALRRGRFWP